MGLSESQQQFVSVLNKNILLSASAGTGKTFTMIQKICNMLSNNIPLKKLLIVTYTDSASSEMRKKLYDEISKRLSECEDPKQKDFLSAQLNDIADSDIGTIHSVCKKIISKYFYVANVDPSFSIISATDKKYLFDIAIAQVFDDYIANNDTQFFTLFEGYNVKRDDSAFKEIIVSLYEYLITMPSDSEFIINTIKNSYNEDIGSNKCANYLLKYYQSKLNKFNSQFASLNMCDFVSNAKYQEYINNRICFIVDCEKINNLVDLINYATNYSFVRRPVCGKNANIDEREFSDELQRTGDDFAKLIKDIKLLSDMDLAKDILIAKENLIKLFEVAQSVKSKYAKLKEKKGLLDFNDLEHLTLTILHSSKADEIKNKYDYIFVDEYQDVNAIQEQIILSLSRENNLNMIGDVKQSIYAFRQSSPEIFIDKFDKYNMGEGGCVIPLNENYRSKSSILYFANNIFGKLINLDTIGIDYNKHAKFVAHDVTKGDVELTIVDKKELDLESQTQKDIEATVVYNKIVDILSSKYIVDGIEKKYELKDICVLCRKKGDLVKAIYSLLVSKGIACNVTFNTNFFETFEINYLISILKCVDNPYDDVAITALAVNEPFNFTMEEIASIRTSKNEPIFNQMLSASSTSDKWMKFINAYNKLVSDFTMNTLYDAFNNFFKTYDLYNYYYSLDNGAIVVQNIKEFLKLTNNSNLMYSVSKMLDYLKYIDKEKYFMTISDPNGVTIQTFHSSKGLEYPAVILAGLGESFNINNHTQDIIFNKEYGVGIKSISGADRVKSDNIVRLACAKSNRISEINEEIRLFYVAVTRAKYALYMTGVADVSKLKNQNIYSCANFIDFIVNAMSSVSVQSLIDGATHLIAFPGDGSLEINVLNNVIEVDSKYCSDQVELLQLDDNDYEVLHKCYDYTYTPTQIPIKNSVTAILKEEVDYENTILYLKNYTLKDGVSTSAPRGAEFGTWYHSVCEKLTYNESREDVASILSELSDPEHDYNVSEDKVMRQIEAIKPLIGKDGIIHKELNFLLKDNYNNLIKSANTTNKIVVQGVIDLVIEHDEGVYLVDFKTNKNVDAGTLIKLYSVQLELYARACELGFGKKILGTYIYSVASDMLIKLI